MSPLFLLLLIVVTGLLGLFTWLSCEAREKSLRHIVTLRLEELEPRDVPSSVQSFDVNLGLLSSDPSQFVDGGNGAAYFIARSAQDRLEIYTAMNGANPTALYNLTAAGASNPQNLFFFNGSLYFTAKDGAGAIELWSAGTGASYSSLTSLHAWAGSGASDFVTDPASGKFYFLGSTGVGLAKQIWVSDGTAQGTQVLNATNGLTINFGTLALINGSLYFGADAGSGMGNQPYQFTLATNQLAWMGPISPTGVNAFPDNVMQFGNRIIFTAGVFNANQNYVGDGIYSWDGQQSTLAVTNVVATSTPPLVVTLGATEYLAFRSTNIGRGSTLALWDGTNAPLIITGSAGALSPTSLSLTADGLYFLGTTSAGPARLCLLTGPSNADLKESVGGSVTSVADLVVRKSDNTLWFVSGRVGGPVGNVVLTTTDASGNVRQVLNGNSSYTGGLTAIGGTLYIAEDLVVYQKVADPPEPGKPAKWDNANLGVELGTYTEEPAPKIKGTTWLDGNSDGIEQGTETKVADVQETLLDSSGNPVIYTNSISDGSFTFNYPAAGTYTVQFAPPSGDTFTQEYQGTDPTVYSDADASGSTALITVTSTGTTAIENAGLVQPPSVSVSGRIWSDVNSNGIQDTNETGQAGVVIDLLDANGNIVGSAVTSADGSYVINGIVPGQTYQLKILVPSGESLTAEHQGADPTKDSDFDSTSALSSLFVVLPGSAAPQFDAGLLGSPITPNPTP
jgi:hypothetical protein